MNSLERTLIEKSSYANGWENVRESRPERVVLASARHKASVCVTPAGAPMVWKVTFVHGPAMVELIRSLPALHQDAGVFHVAGEAMLGLLLRRAAELAMSLPNQAAEQYAAEAAKLDADPPTTTEALALVKQRRGQDLFRDALMKYWGHSCAVMGIGTPELLRASHAKPWARCDSDSERLNVFNGFLLCAHLDALFDAGLMTFDDDGKGMVSDRVDPQTRAKLGLNEALRLRWLAPDHKPFLAWHREHVWACGLSA